jgi:two-component system nitrogen regulation response regulator GlnG
LKRAALVSLELVLGVLNMISDTKSLGWLFWTIHGDLRVIAATNQDLESLAAAGRFRQGLFYRLNVLTIRIPPLQERIEDIPLLLEYFLARMNRELDRHVRSVSPEAMQLLKQHSWPGNVGAS